MYCSSRKIKLKWIWMCTTNFQRSLEIPSSQQNRQTQYMLKKKQLCNFLTMVLPIQYQLIINSFSLKVVCVYICLLYNVQIRIDVLSPYTFLWYINKRFDGQFAVCVLCVEIGSWQDSYNYTYKTEKKIKIDKTYFLEIRKYSI